jgi:hypothetical protein
MAILLWDLVIAAAFVLLAVGALGYILARFLLAGIQKAAGKEIRWTNLCSSAERLAAPARRLWRTKGSFQ